MNKLKLFIAYLYIFTMPMVDVLSFSPWIPLPLMLGGLLLIFSKKIVYDKCDYLIVLTILFSVIPYFWSFDYIGVKTISHFFALIVSVIIYYFLTKTVIRELISSGKSQGLVTAICISLIICSLYICVEFFSDNFFGLDIDNYISHMTRFSYDAIVLNGVYRARGFASESGVMAIYFEMYFFILIGLHRLYKINNKKTDLIKLTFVLSLMAFLLLFSTASILVLALGCIFIFFRQGISLRWIAVSSAISVIMTVFFYNQIENYIENTFLKKVAIFYSDEKIGSASERSEIYSKNLDVFFNFPFGIGHGIAPEVAYQDSNYFGLNLIAGQVSIFLMFLISGGILALAFLILWILNKINKARKGEMKNYVIASILVVVSHYMLVSEYWLPFFWASFALYSEMHLIERDISNRS